MCAVGRRLRARIARAHRWRSHLAQGSSADSRVSCPGLSKDQVRRLCPYASYGDVDLRVQVAATDRGHVRRTVTASVFDLSL